MKNTSLVLIGLTLLLANCGKKTIKIPVAEKAHVETLFVKGDPITIISGSVKDNISSITETNFEKLNNFSLVSVSQFTQKDKVIEEEDKGVESGNEAQEEDTTKNPDRNIYSFTKSGSGYVYASSTDIKFHFEIENNRLDLKSIETKSKVIDVKVLHYSFKNDGNAFSILVETSDSESGRILLNLSFVKKTPSVEITKANTKYKFLFGAGVKVPWDADEVLGINICSTNLPSELITKYQKGIALWGPTLGNRLHIDVNVLTSYPPFSDLNTHCIYTIDNYLTLNSDKYVNAATTYTVGDTFKAKIVDSDILVWVKEAEKHGDSIENQNRMIRVIGHEVGHLLGLDHQFSDDLTSIMSYDGIDYITQYDKDAIAELYKLRND